MRVTRPHTPRRSRPALAAAWMALMLAAAPPATAGARPIGAHAGRRGWTLALSTAHVRADGFSVSGHVRLSAAQAAKRRRIRVVATVRGPAISPLRAAARLTGSRFRLARTAALSGRLTLTVAVELDGRRLGVPAVRSFVVNAPTGGSGAQHEVPKEKSGGPVGEGMLSGTFELVGATESAGKVSGSYFEMFDPGGTVPLPNGNSSLAKGDDTALPPGTNLGLQTFAFQPAPNPAFSGGNLGNSLAGAIIKPQNFFGFNFGIVTQATDPQANVTDPLPAIVNTGGTLSGQLTAWAVGWNGQWFNQGSPKPGGGMPAGTTALSGTIDAATGKFTLTWRSIIAGGPFNAFDGYWHLEGTFVPAA